MHTRFWLEKLEERDHLGDLGTGRMDNIKMDPKELVYEGVD
jgi:hypothetical protein